MNARITSRNGGTSEVATSATGATFVPLPDNRATVVTIYNSSGTSIDWRIDTGSFIPLANGANAAIGGLVNANQVTVRRTDLTNTPVTVKFHFAD